MKFEAGFFVDKKEIDMNDIFKIDDIAIAAFLMAKGARIIEVSSDRPRHFVFIFENEPACQELKREFLNNGTVVARELLARREELMAEMRNRNGDQYGKNNFTK